MPRNLASRPHMPESPANAIEEPRFRRTWECDRCGHLTHRETPPSNCPTCQGAGHEYRRVAP